MMQLNNMMHNGILIQTGMIKHVLVLFQNLKSFPDQLTLCL